MWIFPVLVGGGQRLIDGIDVTHLELVETTPFESGIVVNTYAPKERSERGDHRPRLGALVDDREPVPLVELAGRVPGSTLRLSRS